MKLKQLITGGALAATVLTLGSAQAETNRYEGIVFCKATFVKAHGIEETDISVALPFTTKDREGFEYTHWNLGEVPLGGVADSWHSKDGPGKFVAHNNGRVGAHIYLTSARMGSDSYSVFWQQGRGSYWDGSSMRYSYGPQSGAGTVYVDEEPFFRIFGDAGGVEMEPASSLTAWRRGYCEQRSSLYCLAFTRDMNAKAPAWHMLDHWYWSRKEGSDSYYSGWEKDNGEVTSRDYIGAYMGYLAAGEYMPFDVKFWAPYAESWDNIPEGRAFFTFRVEAASFPLWEHDVDVQ